MGRDGAKVRKMGYLIAGGRDHRRNKSDGGEGRRTIEMGVL